MTAGELQGETPGNDVNQAAVQRFAACLRGDVLHPGDPNSDATRRVFSAMIDRRPALTIEALQDTVRGGKRRG